MGIKQVFNKLTLSASLLALGAGSAIAADAPAPFNGDKPVHIAMIRQMVEGEFMQMYQAGADRQAELMGIKLTTFGKNMDNQAQANFVYQAINMGVDGIIIDHGLTETMKKPAADAVAKGIPVVAFDVDVEHPEINQIAQDDHKLGQLALDAIVKDFDGKANVGYVYVAGILPLDKRHESFEKTKAAHPGIVEVARTGTLDSPFSVKNAEQVKAVLRSQPDINAYFAPFDEFGKGVIMALEENNMTDKVKVYTADISTQDIQLMIKPGSPWVATAATNPAAIGAVSVRAIAKKIAGEPLDHDIIIPPTLFTQQMLKDAGVKSMKQLRDKFPKFNHVEKAMADWIPVDKKGLF